MLHWEKLELLFRSEILSQNPDLLTLSRDVLLNLDQGTD